MNPLNSQPTQTQYFITTTGMPPLAPAATATSILKSTSTTTSMTTIPQSSTAVTSSSFGVNNNSTPRINTMDTKFLSTNTTTNYVPVLLTNQTLISNVDTIQQQQQQYQHQEQKITPNIISVSNAPVVTLGTGSTSQINLIQTVAKPMVMSATNTGNTVTYQVVATPQNNNMTPVITPNGSVSVLLASPQALATGHVAAPIIIRNTATVATTAAASQLKQQQQLPARQHHQQQQQKHQTLHTFNPQHINAEVLKQIIVGNPSSSGHGASTLAPGTTLLKTSLLQNKPVIQQQQQKHPIQTKQIVKNKMMITTPPQQQHQQQQLINQTKNVKSDNSSKMFAALGMELVQAPLVGQTKSHIITHTVQKLPQVSLLQNPKKSINTTTITTNTPTEIINESETNLKNPNEINVGNLSSEVSLIKKPNLTNEKSKETSLLKSSLKTQVDKPETSLLKPVKTNHLDETQQKDLKPSKTTIEKSIKSLTKAKELSKDSTESCSLLKSNKVLKKNADRLTEPKLLDNGGLEEKQESLLKSNNKKSNDTSTQSQATTSPRSQRSKSCNTVMKLQQAADISNNSNNRRYSEPIEIEKCNNLKSLDFKNSNKEDKQEIDSLKSEELDYLLEEFEDEEYLESSGDKSDTTSNTMSEKSKKLDTNTQKDKEDEEIMDTETQKSSEAIKEIEEIKSTSLEENKLQEIIMKDISSDKITPESELINYSNDKITPENELKSSQDIIESDDDDVTILPMEEVEIEQIEIDDDDDDDEDPDMPHKNNNTTSPNSKENEKLNASLLCDEQVLVSSSSSISNHSFDQISATSSLMKSPKLETTSTPLLKKSLMEQKPLMPKDDDSPSNGFSSVLEMLSNFNMLNWKERIGSARGTNLKFQLNEFNLLQIHEKGPTLERRIHTAYEIPIYERESTQVRVGGNNKPPTFYMCRRCNVHGPSVDFLAPDFCSLSCLKRDCRKRQRDDNACILRKRHRYTPQQQQQSQSQYSNQPPPLTYINPPKFRWSSYLKNNCAAIAAPISLFLNPFPTGPNNFVVGMKLEAIDPENCALFCVCTIVEIMGYRLKLCFDGYDSSYDFWLNADSMDIFPPGWCTKTNRIIQPPKGINANKFNWGSYLSKEKALPAPRHLFTHLNSSSLTPRNPFKIAMHLEAEDLNDTGKLCVASIADVLDDRIRIHFDGWDDCYDIIVDINSPYIHPCGWHEGRQQLVVPPDCENSSFIWDDYIRKQAIGEAASEEIFSPRESIHFKANMKLEVVDPRNPSLIRPATVVSHKGHRVKLHLDGWPNDYCFWLEDDSPDLHPIGWCDATCHDLEPPPGFQMLKQKMPCPITGCRGIGNAKKPFLSVHAARDCCPYADENWRIVMERPPRLGYDNISRTLAKHVKMNVQPPITTQQVTRLSDQQILERLQMLDNIKTRHVLIQQEKINNDLHGLTSANIKKEDTPKEIKTYSRQSSSNSITSSTYTTTTTTTSSSSSSSNKNSENCKLDVSLDIAKEFLYDYGPRLQQSYTLWQKNYTFDAEKIQRNPLKWSTTEVSVFVDLYLNCRRTATIFNQEDIDGQALLLLQQADLTDKMGLKLGPAVKLYTCILQLRTLAVTKFDVPYKKSPRK